ncbi:MAG: GTPase HflX [candidate division WOR-3 bacterium]|nr:GTPase HflX [candidate division WOR-3 bacterium]MCX7757740.1 GTPase HflX [candidate division WOR-3 bacterium]MDW7987824.1 GTPase HflX [candidate division WOR-3 bacterium]
MFSNKNKERVLLVGLARSSKERWQVADSLEELASLTKTAGGEVVEKILQIKSEPEPATLVGKGKVLELKEICQKHNIDLLIFDQQLSGTQMRNLQEIIGIRVIDRRALILDIFAQHAQTAEAKTQVELAQLQYRRTNLIGFGTELSRLGGGIGTRGPGEKKLEIDRRRIRERISFLTRLLEKIDREREIQRKKRREYVKIALVGYTNAGKSTLMNQLTGANVKVSPELFATLDPTTKPLVLGKNLVVLVTDTVGFIKNLPHELIASFRATLSEIKNADLILHIIDATATDIENKITVVDETLKELSCENKPVLMVFNKIDCVFETSKLNRLKRTYPNSIFISALTGDGIPKLKNAILGYLSPVLTTKRITLPLERSDLFKFIYEAGDVKKEFINDGKITFIVRGFKPRLSRLKKELKTFLGK